MMRELMFPRFIIPEREDAEARGIAWLKSCLSPEQLADYDRTHSFVVIGGHTRHRYRICWGTSQNIIRIEMLENGRELPVERLCFGPRGVPIGDILQCDTWNQVTVHRMPTDGDWDEAHPYFCADCGHQLGTERGFRISVEKDRD